MHISNVQHMEMAMYNIIKNVYGKTHLKQVGMHLTFSQNSKQGCYSILISKQTKVNQENGTFVFQTINTV